MDGWIYYRVLVLPHLKECTMTQALPYAGSTIAVRPVIPKNKGAKEDATLRMWMRWIIPVTGVSNLLEGGTEM